MFGTEYVGAGCYSLSHYTVQFPTQGLTSVYVYMFSAEAAS